MHWEGHWSGWGDSLRPCSNPGLDVSQRWQLGHVSHSFFASGFKDDHSIAGWKLNLIYGFCCNHFQLPRLKNLFKQYLMPIREVQLWLGQERLVTLSSLLPLGPCSWPQDTAYNCKIEEWVKNPSTRWFLSSKSERLGLWYVSENDFLCPPGRNSF